ncbi:MAG TPA: hypothetical protein VG325_18525 [Solirubrobacteraceae bacterium]|nr:hypothetical protein [Solirubrobacteraceae bacterium]
MPRGASVELQLAAAPPPIIDRGDVVVEVGVTDEEGNLEPAPAGQVIMSVPSPETLRREPEEVHRVVAEAGTGVEPLVIVVEVAEELREDELGVVLAAAARSPRPVILRVIRGD